ncbi:MAG TPA: hypothetical protein PKD85_13565 [Saprospiraceae bacterium]|nr:hypothetical protein [Saprospiraceae bacterium]
MLILIIYCTSCTLFDNNKSNFFFLRIDQGTLIDQNGSILSSKITDVWIYADDQFLGVYPLPNYIPIPYNKNTVNFSIRAGIKPNGRNETSEEYPFYTPLDTTIVISNLDTIEIKPRFRYKPNCKFDIIEDFESGNIFTVGVGQSTSNPCLFREALAGINNSSAGVISLNTQLKNCEITHFSSFSNQNNLLGKVYLELDYWCTEKYFVGTILNIRNQLVKSYDIVIVENTQWNRIYIDLTDKISRLDVASYQVAFSALLDESRRNEGTIYFDNIRLIHF